MIAWLLWIVLVALVALALLYALASFDPHLARTDAGFAVIRTTRAFAKGPTRVLSVRHGWQSGMLLSDPYELVFPYMIAFDAILSGPRSPQRALCIGGGGFSYPKSLAWRGVHVDAVERDPKVISLARRHFALAEAEALTDASGSPLLNVIEADGLQFLQHATSEYDSIVIDAYDGMEADDSFSSPAAIDAAKRHLSPTGALAVNVATPADDPSRLVLWANRLKARFAHVAVVSCTPGDDFASRNHIVLASDVPYRLDSLPFASVEL